MKISALVVQRNGKVPEPAAAGLIVLGLAALGWSRRAKKLARRRAS